MSLFTYVDTPNSNLVCCICQTPFTEPWTTSTCAHTFCRECILLALAHAPLCPVDRSPLTERDLGPADPIVRSLVEELTVECVHSASGCKWTGERQLLTSHLRDDCVYVQVECEVEGCESIIVRGEIKLHREEVHGIIQEDNVKHDEPAGPEDKLKNPESSSIPTDQREQRQQKTIELLMEQNMLLRYRVEVLEGAMQVMKKEMGAVRSALGPWFRLSGSPSNTTGARQIQAQSYQTPGQLHAAHVGIGEDILEGSGSRSHDGQGRNTIGREGSFPGTSSNSGATGSDVQASASASSSATSHVDNNTTPVVTTMSYSGTSSGVAPRQMGGHVVQGHGHRASLPLPGEAGAAEDPLAGYFPTLGEFGHGFAHHGHMGPGVSPAGGMIGGGMPVGLQINPQSVTRVAPLDLGTNLVGSLEGLRGSVVGLAAGIDSLGRRSEIALANEALRLGEEIISLRAGMHGLRMQIHGMMMERNAQITGTGREEGAGPSNLWFGVNMPPRMHAYGGPPNITKL